VTDSLPGVSSVSVYVPPGPREGAARHSSSESGVTGNVDGPAALDPAFSQPIVRGRPSRSQIDRDDLPARVAGTAHSLVVVSRPSASAWLWWALIFRRLYCSECTPGSGVDTDDLRKPRGADQHP